jgi:cytochrome bd-type quinol oxidase subunit 2
LWTNFRLGEHTGILDWYAILVGVTALLVLMMHGALWVQLETENPDRAARVASWTWWGAHIFTAILTTVTFGIQPQVRANF